MNQERPYKQLLHHHFNQVDYKIYNTKNVYAILLLATPVWNQLGTSPSMELGLVLPWLICKF